MDNEKSERERVIDECIIAAELACKTCQQTDSANASLTRVMSALRNLREQAHNA